MLLANKSKVKIEVDINLIFDNDEIKSFRVKEDDVVALTYRSNFKKLQKVGRIKEIKYIPPAKNSNEEANAIFVMDFSGRHNSNIEQVNLMDVLNIEEVEISPDMPDIDYEDLGITIFGGV